LALISSIQRPQLVLRAFEHLAFAFAHVATHAVDVEIPRMPVTELLAMIAAPRIMCSAAPENGDGASTCFQGRASPGAASETAASAPPAFAAWNFSCAFGKVDR
jgi:hypothetical protein